MVRENEGGGGGGDKDINRVSERVCVATVAAAAVEDCKNENDDEYDI